MGNGGDNTNGAVDEIDRQLLMVIQENCKLSLSDIGKRIGLSASSVMERMRKLEERGVIMGFHASVDAKKLGFDLLAFVSLTVSQPEGMREVESQILEHPEILECHQVTGPITLLLKVRTPNTDTLQRLLDELWKLEGVDRTDTMVALSTSKEVVQLDLEERTKKKKSKVTRAKARSHPKESKKNKKKKLTRSRT